MSALNAAICEDNKQSLEYIHQELKKAFSSTEIAIDFFSFTNAYGLLEEIRKGKVFDILFLDIDMPQMNGIDLSILLRKEKYNGLIIFISNKESLVFETFQVQPFRFIRKNHFQKELPQLIHDIVFVIHKKEEILLDIHEQHSNKVYHFNINHIQYIEVLGKYCKVVTSHHETLLRYPLLEFEAKLRPYGFLMTHRSFLVNYRYIFSIGKTELTLDNGSTIPLSRNRRELIKEEYLLLNNGGTLK